MKITIEATEKVASVLVGGTSVPVRIWEGYTDDGVRIYCLVNCIIEHRNMHEAFINGLLTVALTPVDFIKE